MKRLFTFLASSLLISAQAQQESRFWHSSNEKEISLSGKRQIIPQKYKTFTVSGDLLKSALFSALNEKQVSLYNSQSVIELPSPDGTYERYRIVEVPVMEEGLAVHYPGIKTFSVIGIDNPYAHGKLDWNYFGFHGMIMKPDGDFFIDPYCVNNLADYISYYVTDFEKNEKDLMTEGEVRHHANAQKTESANSVMSNIFAGPTLRKYRLAVACTAQYAVAATGLSNPTKAQTLSKVVTSVNRVDGVYETEVAVRMVLVANDTLCLFTSTATQPFTGNDDATTLIGESQDVIDTTIGDANYDIGHTFSTGGGGLADLGCVCQSGIKAQGITGSPSPVGDPYDIDYVAHEMGHEFGGNHTFNSKLSSCGGGNRNAGTAVEPGSGITIMAYAGICGNDDLAAHSIAYFHTISFDEIMAYTNSGQGNNCPVKTTTGNHSPVVTGSATYTIPKSTPFILTGSATDQDGDPLTYSWEEIDKGTGSGGTWNSGGVPYFKSNVPTTSPSRQFPSNTVVLSGNYTGTKGEYVPATAQTLKFRLTARDNKMGGGGVSYAATSSVVVAASGPLTVSYPNVAGITWPSGSTQAVNWKVNGTDQAPVSCTNVNILISLNAGSTFTTLVSNTLNDSTELITVPTVTATIGTCRIKVESVGNIFYDINDKNFTISASSVINPVSSVSAQMTLIPNPATESFSIKLNGLSKTEKSSLLVYDMIGNVVLKDELPAKEMQEARYDIAALAKGVYLVQLINNGNKVISRLVKQ